MSRMLLLALAVLVFIWLLRRALSARKSGKKDPPAKSAQILELVACARCGVHLPRQEAVVELEQGAQSAERFFCSPEHLRLGAK